MLAVSVVAIFLKNKFVLSSTPSEEFTNSVPSTVEEIIVGVILLFTGVFILDIACAKISREEFES